MNLRRLAASASILACVLVASGNAGAHFVLQSPPSWSSQDVLGSPQKLGPCGNEAGGTPTSIVTAYQVGSTIDVTIDEKIFHPGHYRIALAVNDRSELPAEPPVTAGSTACGSAPIDSSPVFPVLADGVLVHTTAFSGPQTVKVTLPPNVTCTKCTLQVIEFMSNHPLNVPGGCYYHHCADISIQTTPVLDAGKPVDEAGAPSGDGGTGGAASDASGCSCSVPQTSSRPGGAVLAALGAVLALVLRRRRARA
jgi:MYXO-CTERM domain-containing protein